MVRVKVKVKVRVTAATYLRFVYKSCHLESP
jgi:hypothetical protein